MSRKRFPFIEPKQLLRNVNFSALNPVENIKFYIYTVIPVGNVLFQRLQFEYYRMSGQGGGGAQTWVAVAMAMAEGDDAVVVGNCCDRPSRNSSRPFYRSSRPSRYESRPSRLSGLVQQILFPSKETDCQDSR